MVPILSIVNLFVKFLELRLSLKQLKGTIVGLALVIQILKREPCFISSFELKVEKLVKAEYIFKRHKLLTSLGISNLIQNKLTL